MEGNGLVAVSGSGIGTVEENALVECGAVRFLLVPEIDVESVGCGINYCVAESIGDESIELGPDAGLSSSSSEHICTVLFDDG